MTPTITSTPTPTVTNTPACTVSTTLSGIYTQASGPTPGCPNNGSFATAAQIFLAPTPVIANQGVTGSLYSSSTCSTGTQDYYEFTTSAPMTQAHIYLDCYSAPQSMTLTLFNAAQTPVATAVVGTSSNPIAITFTPSVNYYLEVSNGIGPYEIKITNP
jgi:hypothetical protein